MQGSVLSLCQTVHHPLLHFLRCRINNLRAVDKLQHFLRICSQVWYIISESPIVPIHWPLTFESIVTDRLLHGAHDAFRTIVPHAKDRVPLTRHTAWIPVVCYAPFFFLAYLARRPDTYLIRLLILPSVITLILVAAYRFTWTQPELNVYNWGQCTSTSECT